jgi:Predicted membrane protein
MIRRWLVLILPVWIVTGCHSGPDSALPGDSDDHAPFHGIDDGDSIHLIGTEPFWGGSIAKDKLTYTTPENPKGNVIQVSRFAGRGGLSYSGELNGSALTLAVTPGTCSDGMSDRAYPFAATLRIGEKLRQGCAWTGTLAPTNTDPAN